MFAHKITNDEQIGKAHIFREYDIRGIAGQDLSVADAYLIGQAFVTICLEQGILQGNGENSICVGYDARLSSPDLAKALVAGVRSKGGVVASMGLCSTPLLHHAIYNTKGAVAGVMITGSHNPPVYNGCKFFVRNGTFFGSDIKQIQSLIISDSKSVNGMGDVEDIREWILDHYLAYLKSHCNFVSNIRVAWDPGNGAVGLFLRELCDHIPGEHIVINDKVDGNFSDRDPDPSDIKNLLSLQKVVRAQKCDLGLAFDGDGDRLVVLDRYGHMISGDKLLALFVEDFRRLNKSSIKFIADVKSSKHLFSYARDHEVYALMWKCGHSLIKAKSLEEKVDLAGEVSGHFFFADNHYIDDGVYAALRLLAYVSHLKIQGVDVNVVLEEYFPKSFDTGEVKIACAEERKKAVIEEIRERLLAIREKFSCLDGIRVEDENGWWLLRASNTQPALIMRSEASSKERLFSMLRQIREQLMLSDIKNALDDLVAT